MDTGRRQIVAGLAGLMAVLTRVDAAHAAPIVRTRGAARIDVRNHGARGDGMRDDTLALQSAIDALPAEGGTVVVPAGRYLIDPQRSVWLRGRMHLAMAADAHLVARANAAERAYVLTLQGIGDVEVSGGRIVGDRDVHLGSSGEWGHGVMVRGAERVTLRDLHISRCWGDGISVGGMSVGGMSGERPVPSRDVLIVNVTCAGNRRQGLTIARARQVRVIRSSFVDTGGTLPGCGIDVEPDANDSARFVLIADCLVRGNQGPGIHLYQRVTDVTVRNCTIERNHGDGVFIADAQGCVIAANVIRGNGQYGLNVRGASRDIHVSKNRFSDNFRAARARRPMPERRWMHVDVAETAMAVRIDNDNVYGG